MLGQSTVNLTANYLTFAQKERERIVSLQRKTRLRRGMPVTALVKAPWVILARWRTRPLGPAPATGCAATHQPYPHRQHLLRGNSDPGRGRHPDLHPGHGRERQGRWGWPRAMRFGRYSRARL
ncbi:hypothetical protein DFAR_1040015 [Desulfarculales bacterium]